MSETFAVPDLMEPIVAARSWVFRPAQRGEQFETRIPRYFVDRPGRPARLKSLNHDDTWEPGENIAGCRGSHYGRIRELLGGGPQPTHDAPVEGCACGFYAVSDLDALLDYADSGSIFGVVHLYGRIVVGERGWRAEKAKVAGIVRDRKRRRICAQAAREYRVPLLRSWPKLTDPKEVMPWISEKSTESSSWSQPTNPYAGLTIQPGPPQSSLPPLPSLSPSPSLSQAEWEALRKWSSRDSRWGYEHDDT